MEKENTQTFPLENLTDCKFIGDVSNTHTRVIHFCRANFSSFPVFCNPGNGNKPG